MGKYSRMDGVHSFTQKGSVCYRSPLYSDPMKILLIQIVFYAPVSQVRAFLKMCIFIGLRNMVIGEGEREHMEVITLN